MLEDDEEAPSQVLNHRALALRRARRCQTEGVAITLRLI